MNKIKFLEKLKESNPEQSYQIDQVIADFKKRLGLVWEEKVEKVESLLLENQPVFSGDYVNQNMLIDGDNLISLELLKKTHKGKIDVIFIDPPYNTGNNDFKYNDDYIDKADTFKHSKWLSFMKKRLVLASKLLSDNGFFFVSIDYRESAYLKILLDDVFGEVNFAKEIIWRMGSSSGFKTGANNLIRAHETIYFYTKRPSALKNAYNKIYLPYGEDYIKRQFKKDDNGELYRNRGKEKKYLKDMKGIALSDVWTDIPSLQTTTQSKEVKDVKKIWGDNYDGQKPIKLLERIINLHKNKNAVVLDFFAGSGTTAIAVKNLNKKDNGNRQFILCDYSENTKNVLTSHVRMKDELEYSLLRSSISSDEKEIVESSLLLSKFHEDDDFTTDLKDFDKKILPDYFYEY